MRFFRKAKDGGPKSTVTGYWLFEIKWLFSIVLLKFENGSRDEYHSHAFNSLNWVLSGEVEEQPVFSLVDDDDKPQWPTFVHRRSLIPVITKRSTFHRVVSRGTTWVFSIRGPWRKKWLEYDPKTRETVILTHGRKVV